MSRITMEAERVAEQAATITEGGSWACAYHHASDLLHFRHAKRGSTRARKAYKPNRVEQAVERLIQWDRNEEGIA